jgi:hypothetical protein
MQSSGGIDVVTSGVSQLGAAAKGLKVVLEVLPRDLSAYRAGNTGVPYAFRFESGQAGPHVAINALTHGNEFCGMVAACALLDAGVRPERGTLTISFANVAAYESFDPKNPFASRQITHNLNRIWSAAQLDGTEQSADYARAREMRPLWQGVQALLDIHSTSQDVVPFFVYPGIGNNAALASSMPVPGLHLVMPNGIGTGTPLIEYGQFGKPLPDVLGAMVVECGQHFLKASGDLATEVSLAFLVRTGVLSAARASVWGEQILGRALRLSAPTPPKRYSLLGVHVIRTPELRWTRPIVGLEVFAKGELIGTDGEFEVRSPCDGCTVFMPHRPDRPAVPGVEGVYLTQEIAAER